MIIILGKLRGLEVKNYLFPEGIKGEGDLQRRRQKKGWEGLLGLDSYIIRIGLFFYFFFFAGLTSMARASV